MKIRVALNGFGDAGQQLLHHIYSTALSQRFEVVAINELESPMSAVHNLVNNHIIRSNQSYQIAYTTSEILINQQTIPYFSILNEAELPWEKLNVDVVVESSTRINQVATSQQHLRYGARQVLIANNAFPSDRLWVNGISDSAFSVESTCIEQASELTQAIVPIIAVINKEFEIAQCYIENLCQSTYPSTCLDQNSIEVFSQQPVANLSLPMELEELSEIKGLFPELQNKLSGRSIQCEFKSHSLAILNFDLNKNISALQVTSAIENASETWLKSIIGIRPENWLNDTKRNCLLSSYVCLERTTVMGNKLRIPVVFDNQTTSAQRIFEFAAQLRHQSQQTTAAI